MLPFEPGRFSTTTGWPAHSESRCPMTRAEISGAPPGGIGTISLIGRNGYCAHEATENKAANASAVKRLGAVLMLSPQCPACDAMIFDAPVKRHVPRTSPRSEEHTSELQSPDHLVCR